MGDHLDNDAIQLSTPISLQMSQAWHGVGRSLIDGGGGFEVELV